MVRKFVLVLAGLVLFLSLLHPVIAATAEEKVKLGNRLLNEGYPDQALIFYDQAVDINPHYWPAYLNRGKALLRLGQRRYALDDFKKTLELNPDATEACRLLGSGRRTGRSQGNKPRPKEKTSKPAASTRRKHPTG
jgi:tetratricopeptide (TPR) repeat protein